jgi:hypothetical protein
VILEAGVARGLFDLTDDSHTLGRNIVALEDAHGLHVLMGESPIDRREAERLIVAHASAVTRCDLRAVAG